MALLVLAAGCGGPEAEQSGGGSVAITTATARQGHMTRWISGYGSAVAASNGTATLSVAQPGQVTAMLVTPGAAVRAGEPILTFAIAPSALAGFEAASTTLAVAIHQRDTTRALLAQQLATRDQLTQAEKAVVDAQAALAAQRREGAANAVQTLRAPFDGVVATIPVAVGDRTQAGVALATIAKRGALIATVGVDPAERARLHPGSAARVARLNGGGTLPGTVRRIDAQLNPTTHLVDVDVGFPTGALLSGEAVRVDLAAGESSGWLVPHDSVVTGDQGDRVFQISNGKAKAVPITVIRSGDHVDVVSGAIDGRRPVVVTGAFQLEDGGAVRTAR
ncbi:efflux RND transporter periplasmic adaptor subunit [Sphingomonas morindae]|uniref:efflux RND transporter periplasmic adaptor subunit n=1 Tax=Sphingomonas morindae TaxID=1541170 RepID=UPI00349E98CC